MLETISLCANMSSNLSKDKITFKLFMSISYIYVHLYGCIFVYVQSTRKLFVHPSILNIYPFLKSNIHTMPSCYVKRKTI